MNKNERITSLGLTTPPRISFRAFHLPLFPPRATFTYPPAAASHQKERNTKNEKLPNRPQAFEISLTGGTGLFRWNFATYDLNYVLRKETLPKPCDKFTAHSWFLLFPRFSLTKKAKRILHRTTIQSSLRTGVSFTGGKWAELCSREWIFSSRWLNCRVPCALTFRESLFYFGFGPMSRSSFFHILRRSTYLILFFTKRSSSYVWHLKFVVYYIEDNQRKLYRKYYYE